jgi:ABC-type proline/glycine betaine transport system permease subunit
VELPAGNHRVEFVYDPISFKIGLMISSFTVVFLIAVPLAGMIRRKRRFRQSVREVLNQAAHAASD